MNLCFVFSVYDIIRYAPGPILWLFPRQSTCARARTLRIMQKPFTTIMTGEICFLLEMHFKRKKYFSSHDRCSHSSSSSAKRDAKRNWNHKAEQLLIFAHHHQIGCASLMHICDSARLHGLTGWRTEKKSRKNWPKSEFEKWSFETVHLLHWTKYVDFWLRSLGCFLRCPLFDECQFGLGSSLFPFDYMNWSTLLRLFCGWYNFFLPPKKQKQIKSCWTFSSFTLICLFILPASLPLSKWLQHYGLRFECESK